MSVFVCVCLSVLIVMSCQFFLMSGHYHYCTDYFIPSDDLVIVQMCVCVFSYQNIYISTYHYLLLAAIELLINTLKQV